MKNPILFLYVKKDSKENIIWISIKKLIMGKNLLNVRNAEKNNICVKFVEMLINIVVDYRSIREIIIKFFSESSTIFRI